MTRVANISIENITNVEPRKDDTLQHDLEASLEKHGLVAPIVVVPTDVGYRIAPTGGKRRVAAAIYLGWSELPALIIEDGRI